MHSNTSETSGRTGSIEKGYSKIRKEHSMTIEARNHILKGKIYRKHRAKRNNIELVNSPTSYDWRLRKQKAVAG
jgi:hypothetical protein